MREKYKKYFRLKKEKRKKYFKIKKRKNIKNRNFFEKN